MSLNPLNELKRRLEDVSTPLPKRFCLAKNVIQTHHFAKAPKERVIAEWLDFIMQKNNLTSEELKNVLDWVTCADDMSSELKCKLLKIVSEFFQRNIIKDEDIYIVLYFIENDKIASALQHHNINEYLSTMVTILQHLRETESCGPMILSQKVLNNILKYYRASKSKMDFIIQLLNGENLETIFSFLDTQCCETVKSLCRDILFPKTKMSVFLNFLQTLIQQDNTENLNAQENYSIQSVMKIMSTFFTFPNGRTTKDAKFLSNFIEVFVSSYCKDSQLIFAFYIMVTNSLNMAQNYLTPANKMPPIVFEENDVKIKKDLFLKMLETLLVNDIDISVKLTNTFGDDESKVEIKKNFTSFLQIVMMGQLTLEGKVDKTTMQIIKIALMLDPIMIQQKMDQILPAIMAAKKSGSSVKESYTEMLHYLLETLFKLSKGTLFLNKILPSLVVNLEACNTKQFQLRQKLKECTIDAPEYEKLLGKIITGQDIFPQECVDTYGKLTSELLFRQNSDLLVSLQEDFQVHCLLMLEEGFVSPSIIIIAEVLSAILSSYFERNKMADHTVPQQISEHFWTTFRKFGDECLKKLGECILKLNYNPPLLLSFLKLSLGYCQLKLINLAYCNYKLELSRVDDASQLYDMTVLLPFLNGEQWTAITSRIVDNDSQLIMDKLLVLKTWAVKLSVQNSDDVVQTITAAKGHLIKHLDRHVKILRCESFYCKIILIDMDKSQTKQLAKCLMKLFMNNEGTDILNNDLILKNAPLLNQLVIETSKNILKCMKNTESLSKAMNKSEFDFITFSKSVNITEFFNDITVETESYDEDRIARCIEILKQLRIYYLEEMHQLIAIFVLLSVKKCCQSKKLKKNVDFVLQSIFEESAKWPDMFKIFPVNYIFSFDDRSFMNILTLKIKASNQLLIIKSILESGVKKVKIDCEIVKGIVGILLKEQTKIYDDSSIEYFSDPVFQITCIILPVIAKEKKAITTSAYRSILAGLQEQLHSKILEAFKKIDFSKNSSSFLETTGNTEDSVVVSESAMATLNAIEAYSLTLSKCCESSNTEEVKNLECLSSGLEYFLHNAINSIQRAESKSQHVHSSIQLINVILRHIKKLESHEIFQKKDELFLRIWQCINARLALVYDERQKTRRNRLNERCLEDIVVSLKFLSELSTVECFSTRFMGDLKSLIIWKEPSAILNDEQLSNSVLTSHRVAKYIVTNCLKANIVGPKCAAICKLMFNTCKNTRTWIRQHCDSNRKGVQKIIDSVEGAMELQSENMEESVMSVINVHDVVCELLELNLDCLSEVILAAKKVTLDYKFLDSIFELQHLIQFILGLNTMSVRCEISWHGFFAVYEKSLALLNSMLVSREEILEDRWPCYMQCYRTLVCCLCERSTFETELDKATEERLARMAHTIEKLTQSICKRKTHISRLAAYTIADVCTWLAHTAPSKAVRQHLENSVALLIQVSDSSYTMAFLKRALAGTPGQLTLTNLYTVYKTYHKYVGNA